MKDQIVVPGCLSCSILAKATSDTGQILAMIDVGWKIVFQLMCHDFHIFDEIFICVHSNVNHIDTISNGYNCNYSLNGNTIDIGIIK